MASESISDITEVVYLSEEYAGEMREAVRLAVEVADFFLDRRPGIEQALGNNHPLFTRYVMAEVVARRTVVHLQGVVKDFESLIEVTHEIINL